jgi:hypothetical protein
MSILCASAGHSRQKIAIFLRELSKSGYAQETSHEQGFEGEALGGRP